MSSEETDLEKENTSETEVEEEMSSGSKSMSNAKFKVEKFDGKNNFTMWQCDVRDALT